MHEFHASIKLKNFMKNKPSKSVPLSSAFGTSMIVAGDVFYNKWKILYN